MATIEHVIPYAKEAEAEQEVTVLMDTSDGSKSASPLAEIRDLKLPRCCPEKIIFCLDVSDELSNVQFKLNDGQKLVSLHRLKKVVRIFVNLKASFSFGHQHQFGLILLGQEPIWRLEPTQNVASFLSALRELDLMSMDSSEPCNMNTIFDYVARDVELPALTSPLNERGPPFVVRLITVYTRSRSIPLLSQHHHAVVKLMDNANFFSDMVYIHEYPAEDNVVNNVFTKLGLLELPRWRVYEVGPNTTLLHSTFADLLMHPLIRPDRQNIPGTPVEPDPSKAVGSEKHSQELMDHSKRQPNEEPADMDAPLVLVEADVAPASQVHSEAVIERPASQSECAVDLGGSRVSTRTTVQTDRNLMSF